MSDIFIEQLVKKEKTQADTIKMLGCYVLAVLLSFLSLTQLPSILPVVLIVTFFLAYYFSTKLNVEYEYIFTNTELDIDCVYNRQKRKRLYSFDLKESFVIYKTDNSNHNNKYNDLKTIDLSSGRNIEKTYAIIQNLKGNQVKIIIEPNETLIDGISKKISSRIFLKD